MPRGSHGQWRPSDPVQAAIITTKIATGEIEEELTHDDGQPPVLVQLALADKQERERVIGELKTEARSRII